MSRRTTILIVVLLLVALVAVQRCQLPPRPSVFADLSFDQAQAAAANSSEQPPRLLVVDFGASWCPPCREMDRSTWTDPALVAWLDEHAITIKIDADEEQGRTRGFGVSVLPTVVVLRGTQELGRITGQRSARELLDWLRALQTRS